MRLNIKFAIVFLSGIITSCANGADFAKGNLNLICQLDETTSVQVEVRTAKVDSQFPYDEAYIWGGEFESADKVIMPKEVIKSMNVRIGTKRIFVPLSAFCNLGNPNNASLEKTKGGFTFTLFGGGTASSYKAELTFSKQKIKHKKVTLDVFPNDRWEETVYSFISSDSEM